MKAWRRRSSGGPALSGFGPIVLDALEGELGELTWDWYDANPDEFRVSRSNDGGENWEILGVPVGGGAARSETVDFAPWVGQQALCRVEARTGGVTIASGVSNVVTVLA